MINTEVGVVGGGISGLHTAFELAKRGIDVKVLEARDRVGGRILSPSLDDTSCFDLGPSWFWPGQHHIGSLVDELGLSDRVFEQYSSGDSLFEPAGGTPQRGVGGFSMAGSFRMRGGLAVITEALRSNIVALAGDQAIADSSMVSNIERTEQSIVVSAAGKRYACRYAILALPPRLAMRDIQFSPPLPASRVDELNAVSTWMAGHAKVMVIFKTPFWREHGFSGDIISQTGPLAELHDASAVDPERYALFGFFATPPEQRSDDNDVIEQSIKAQLRRLFGSDMPEPEHFIFKDWAKDSLTATELDQHIPNHHPMNQLSGRLEDGWQGRIVWSGSETASGHYNGYIEGALTASHEVLGSIDIDKLTAS